MIITINIKEPFLHEEDLIGLKEALAYVLEIHKLTVGRIDIQEGGK
jgi:hypothetical protein